jgi:hypothetical protein
MPPLPRPTHGMEFLRGRAQRRAGPVRSIPAQSASMIEAVVCR